MCDVVGLYLDPPDDAAVVGIDEKPRIDIQAIDLTDRILPMRPGCSAQPPAGGLDRAADGGQPDGQAVRASRATVSASRE